MYLSAYNELCRYTVGSNVQKKGGTDMENSERKTKTYIAMTSITYAMKAKDVLNGLGYFCEVVRTPKNAGSGCGYSLLIKDNPDLITARLDKNSLPYKSVLHFRTLGG